MIDPVAFSVLGLDVYWYGICYALSFLFGYYFIMFYGVRFSGFQRDFLENCFLIFVVSSVLGGRLFHIVFYNLGYYLSDPIQILMVQKGGMSAHGGIFFGFLVLWLYSRKKGVSFLKLADLFAIPGALGFAFGRLANFVNQELVGRATDNFLGVVFPLHDDVRRWPSTLLESAKNMLTFQVLFFLYVFKDLRPGIITAWFFWLYNGLRFFVDFLREPETLLFGVLPMGQFLSFVFFMWGFWFYFQSKKEIGGSGRHSRRKKNRRGKTA